MFDPKMIQSDFPMLQVENQNRPLVYLDSAATSLKPKQMIQAMTEYYAHYGATVNRGVYELSHKATDVYEKVRKKIAQYIHAQSENEIVYTRNATASLNLVAYQFGKQVIKQDDEIMITCYEHHANFIPWQQLSIQTGAKLIIVAPDEKGLFSVNHLKKYITDKTKLIAIHHVSNVIGDTVDVTTLCAYAKSKGIYTIVDGSQAIPHMAINVQHIDCDFYIFTGHKMLGPTGIGVLYGRYQLLEMMEPLEYGGDMIDIVGDFNSTWKKPPHRFEAGTPQIAEVIGLGTALDYLSQFNIEAIHQHVVNLASYAKSEIAQIGGFTIYNEDIESNTVAFNSNIVPMHDVASYLNKDGIAIRAGHHCAQPLMRYLKVNATLRASFYLYNTIEDVDALVASLKKMSQREDAFLDVLFE
ncbi:MAG: SufS family cysteine desulfurase [Culicoidibacterales bacterium]